MHLFGPLRPLEHAFFGYIVSGILGRWMSYQSHLASFAAHKSATWTGKLFPYNGRPVVKLGLIGLSGLHVTSYRRATLELVVGRC